MLKVGDVVMFDPEGNNSYVEHFGGNIATVKRSSINSEGINVVRVEWVVPVWFLKSFTSVSHFSASYFTKCENHG